MADKILLCISATQAVVAHTRGHGVVRCGIFPSDEAGLAAFDDFLSTTGSAPVYLAADTVEEDYRFETLPHATGADRNGLLARKLKQYYRNTPYVASLFRGRTGEKRRDDRYLFAALTNPSLIDPWLAAVTRRRLPVAGLYLVSMLTEALIRKLGYDRSRVLVVAPHGAGLRLTFYKDGEFCVSRLSRSGAGSDGTHTLAAYASEIASTRAYLATLHLDATDDPLTLLFLDSDDRLLPAVEHVAAEIANVQCVHIDRDRLIRQVPMAPDHLDVALETVYLKLMAERAPDANLAPPAITADHRRFQRRNALYAASALLGLAGMVWSGYNLWQARDLAQQTADDAKRTATAQARYRDITREFPAAPTTSANLVQAVEMYQKISKTVRSPQPFMRVVARAIQPHPEVYLQEIRWNATAANTEAPGAAHAGQSGAVTGEIRPFHGDYRSATDVINGIAKRLGGDPAVAQARVLKYPLNVNPALGLSGNTKDASAHAGVAEFTITLTLKPDA